MFSDSASVMSITAHRSKRKATGGIYRNLKGKRMASLAGMPSHTKLGSESRVIKRKIGGGSKISLLSHEIINVFDKKSNKYHKTKILTVVDNKANRNFIRRNIMTKGTIVKTELGNARITSRPGQEGSINGVLEA